MAKRAFVFFVLLAWCGFLLAGRVWRSHQLTYAFLVWNLFLAVIPAVAATLVATSRATAARLFWAIVWLLFLPNAPYFVTDFVHLTLRPPIPLWYDVALLLSGFGVYLGRFLRRNSWDPIANPACCAQAATA